MKTLRPGYTLIEVLIAFTVLIIGFSALTTMTTRARRAAIAAEELSTVQLTCQTRINEMLAGIRPFSPVFREPITGLDAWFLTVELFPASKPGITAVRAEMSRDRQPGEISARFGGTDSFAVTHWVTNSRLDPQLVETMQRNPYALTVAGMMPSPQYGMGDMMGGANSMVDMFAGGSMPGNMGGGGFAGGMSGGFAGSGSLPPFDYSDMSDTPPPLLLDDETNSTTSGFTTSEQRRQYRESLVQRRTPTSSDIDPFADTPPPLELPLNDPLESTTVATTTTLPTDDTSTTGPPPSPGDDSLPQDDNAPSETSDDESGSVSDADANDSPDQESESTPPETEEGEEEEVP